MFSLLYTYRDMKWRYFLLLPMLLPLTALGAQCDDLGDLGAYDDAQLQQIFEACNKEIAEQKKTLNERKAETSTISTVISNTEAQIRKSNAAIRAKEIEIFRLNNEINNQKKKLVTLDEQIRNLKSGMRTLIREKNELDNFSFIEALFSRKTISDFFVDWSNFDVIKIQLAQASTELEDLKGAALEKTETLAESEARERELKAQKEVETAAQQQQRAEQKVLLDISKREQAKVSDAIKEKEALKAQIRSRLFKIADGGSIRFGDALNLVRPYEKALGVDAAFILSVLFQESGWNNQIGGNIGQCTYNYVHPKTGRQVMSPKQVPSYLQLMRELGRNPNTQKVSCPIPRDGAYGGAMGPAQFIPTTWMGYRGKAATILGKPATAVSPFNNQDAFVASGTFLRDLYYSNSCSNYAKQYANVSPAKTLRERCAAASYYAGPGNWFAFRFTYGEPVVKRANKFRKDIETLGL